MVQPKDVVLPNAHVFLCGRDVLLIPRGPDLARGRLYGRCCSATLSSHRLKLKKQDEASAIEPFETLGDNGRRSHGK